jgi:hypothetical protein
MPQSSSNRWTRSLAGFTDALIERPWRLSRELMLAKTLDTSASKIMRQVEAGIG